MKHLNILAAAAMAVAIAAPAFAADMPYPAQARNYQTDPAPMFNWTGLYIGANGGYGSTSVDGLKMNGGLLGGTIGANFQANGSPLVLGVEADWDKSWIKGSLTEKFPGETVTVDGRIDSMATVGGRIGIAHDRWLAYGKAGVAWAQAKAKVTDTTLGVTTVITGKENLTGAFFGGGIEYALNKNWSLKGEYIRTSFKEAGEKLNVDLFKAGVNYRFSTY